MVYFVVKLWCRIIVGYLFQSLYSCVFNFINTAVLKWWLIGLHLRSCQTRSGRTRWDTRWWCSWPPGWFSPQLHLPPTHTSPASPLLRLPLILPLPRTAASCRSPCPDSGPFSVGQAEQGTLGQACSLHRPAEKSGMEMRVTWSWGWKLSPGLGQFSRRPFFRYLPG